MKNILVVGSLNMDLIIHSAVMPKLGETLAGNGFSIACGGKGANQAAAAAKLGGNVRMLGAVGNDDNGRTLVSVLKNLGVDCSGISAVSDSTGVAVIAVVNGDNFIIIDHGANFSVTPEVISADSSIEMFKWADIVVFQLEIPIETVKLGASLAKENGAMVILNPAPMDTSLDTEILSNVDLIIPNEHEAALLLGYEVTDETLEEKAESELFSRYGCEVIITLGSRGSLYFDGKNFYRQSAYKVTAVDTTAAGDSFIGGLCVALSDGCDMQKAMKFASAVSACAISKSGAIPSLPFRCDVENMISNYLK